MQRQPKIDAIHALSRASARLWPLIAGLTFASCSSEAVKKRSTFVGRAEASGSEDLRASEQRVFKKLALEAIDKTEAKLSLVEKVDVTTSLLMQADGHTWTFDDAGGKLAPAASLLSPPDSMTVLTTGGGYVWVISNDEVGRTKGAVPVNQSSEGTPDLNGGRVAKPTGGEVIGAADDLLLTLEGDEALIYRWQEGAITVMSARLPADLASGDSAVVGGLAQDRQSVWFWGNDRLAVLTKPSPDAAPGWLMGRLALDFGETVRVQSLAASVAIDASGTSVSGSLLALTSRGLFFSAAVDDVDVTEDKIYQWVEDIRPIADRSCLQCHVELEDPATWNAKKDAILRLVAVENKGEGFTMPPLDTAPALGMPDADRRAIVAWLNQGGRAAGGGQGGGTNGDPNRARITGELKAMSDKFCLSCHSANAPFADWWQSHRAQALSYISDGKMPKAPSAEAARMTDQDRTAFKALLQGL